MLHKYHIKSKETQNKQEIETNSISSINEQQQYQQQEDSFSVEYTNQINKDLVLPQLIPQEHPFVHPLEDNFCSGLVTKIFVVERRLAKIPFSVCIISHTSLVCETTKKKAYLIEYCENLPVLIHDVTSDWSFKPTKHFYYANYKYRRDYNGTQIPVVSYNVQYVAKLFDTIQLRDGRYILSSNNCHKVQELVRLSLGLATNAELHYGSLLEKIPIGFDPENDVKPYYFI